jgi:hypothetical protein
MRNTLIVVLAGSVLCGCLDSGTSGFHEENEAAAEQPTNVSPIIGGSPPSTILVNEMYEKCTILSQTRPIPMATR